MGGSGPSLPAVAEPPGRKTAGPGGLRRMPRTAQDKWPLRFMGKKGPAKPMLRSRLPKSYGGQVGEGRPWRRASVRESEGGLAAGPSCPRLACPRQDEAAGKGKKRGRLADAAAPDSEVLSV